jgi:hypothetical protein
MMHSALDDPLLSPAPDPCRNARADHLGSRVESLYARSGYLALRQISCLILADHLILSGTLPSYYLKQLAQSLIVEVAGALPIINQIQIHPSSP